MVQAEQAVERKVNRKTRSGVVVSHGNDKTVIVAVGSAARHRLYGKVIRRTKRYPVHDPENVATTGDLVVIEECRPISKTKRWRLVEVITEREVAEVAPESIDEALVDEMQRTAARAAAEAETEEPTAEAAAEEPAAEAETEEPAAEAAAEERAAEAEAEEPAAEAEAEEPAAEAAAEEPAAEAEAEEPAAEAAAEEPAAEAAAEEPAAEAEAEEASEDDEEKTEEAAAQ